MRTSAAALVVVAALGPAAHADSHHVVTRAEDPIGDVPDRRGDITVFAVQRIGDTVQATVNVANPTNPDETSQWDGTTGPTFFLDTNGDGAEDYLVDIFYTSPLIAEVYDAETEEFVCSAAASFNGNGYQASFAKSCIGNPPALRAGVEMLWDTNPDDLNAPIYSDVAPNSGWSYAWAPDSAPPPPPPPPQSTSGYWMVGQRGDIYAFGDARWHGNAATAPYDAVDIEPTPSFNGYWIVDSRGNVYPRGGARAFGNALPQLSGPETVTSMSSTPDGGGYWLFTTMGRVIPYGNAPFYGDMAGVPLNGPVLDSVRTAKGKGYYMVASDGGIFAFGDARFHGSMGGRHLNAPVQSLAPDRDGAGYWLVASDGGVFAFDAPFRGSMGATPLNRPVVGLVRYGNGYLMVATDGGIFNFSDKPFAGSLGASPPALPIVAVGVVDK